MGTWSFMLGCCCGSNWITTRVYDAAGKQLWKADFGVATAAGCLDGDDNVYVGGARSTDLSVKVIQAGGGGASSIQQIKPGGQKSGQWRFVLDGYRSALLDWDCDAADVQAAADAMPNIGPGGVVVTGGPFPKGRFTLTFGGPLAGVAVSTLTFETYKLGGVPTIKKYRARDGKLLKSVGTEAAIIDLVFANGAVYASTARSAGIRCVQSRIEAFGEVSGNFKIGFSSLDWSADITLPATAADVQGAMDAMPNFAGWYTCSGGPLPDCPIFLTPVNPTSIPLSIGIQDGNTSGGVTFYKFDLDLAPTASWPKDASMSQGILAADSGGSVYFAGGDFTGTVENPPPAGGEDKTDWHVAIEDVWVRKYDADGSPQTLGIKAGQPPVALAIDAGGQVYCNSASQGSLFKFYETGTPTGGTFVVGSTSVFGPTSSTLDFDVKPSADFLDPKAIMRQLYGLGTGVVVDVPAGSWDLSKAPIWVAPGFQDGIDTGPFTLISSSITGGAANIDPSLLTRDLSRLSYYDTSGNLVDATALNGVAHKLSGYTSGRAMTFDAGGHLLISPPDVASGVVATLVQADFSAVVWNAVDAASTPETSVTYCVGFDASGNLFQGGTRGSSFKSTRKFDNANPPNLVWTRDHGVPPGSDAFGPSVVDLRVTSTNGVMTTGVRVSGKTYP